MDAFESVVAMLLRREGYWILPSLKVELTKEEKRQIGRHSAPRWEIDLVAYNGLTNELLAVECKSFLDSTGVIFRNGQFEPPKTYKLFVDDCLREVVLNRLAQQLQELKACRPSPTVQLCLAAGKIAAKSDLAGLKEHFVAKGWKLLDRGWLTKRLMETALCGYENDVVFVVTKLLLRK
jgi:hypothetical protein